MLMQNSITLDLSLFLSIHRIHHIKLHLNSTWFQLPWHLRVLIPVKNTFREIVQKKTSEIVINSFNLFICD